MYTKKKKKRHHIHPSTLRKSHQKPNSMHFSPFKGSNNQYAKHPTLSSWIKTLSQQAYNIIIFLIATKKNKNQKPLQNFIPCTHHSSSITLIIMGDGGGGLTIKWFLCVFLASVCPFPVCEGQVSILDHMLWIAREKIN